MSFIKFKGLYLTLILALLILFLSLKPPSETDTKLLVSDKVLHLISYFLLVLPVLLERIYPQFLVFIVALAYGGFIELIQPFWGRDADIMDFFANAVGIILGILIVQGFIFIFKLHPPHMR
ncbi:MAG: VanZ family protein [Alphaproteobacteria bacterium]|nr:VanZ family protein [Alphaproteobacteria bacterium]